MRMLAQASSSFLEGRTMHIGTSLKLLIKGAGYTLEGAGLRLRINRISCMPEDEGLKFRAERASHAPKGTGLKLSGWNPRRALVSMDFELVRPNMSLKHVSVSRM